VNIHEFLGVVRSRLDRKFRKAEQAFIAERTLKKTDNCHNRGRHLDSHISHCKINAMGGHESGASQCWDEKARLCPYFELRQSVSKTKDDFRSMEITELSIRWPSLGELIRIEHLILQLDEIKGNSGETSSESPVSSERRDFLSDSVPARSDSSSGSLFGVIELPGSGHAPASGGGSEEDRRSDAGRPGSGPEDDQGMSLANLRRSRDRSDADRAAI
jgi:hypothetical protein